MILGRPVNLWTGLIQGVTSAILGMTAALLPDSEAKIVGVILGGVGTILGIVIAFLAGQPPTLSPGDTYHIQTPAGEPNTTSVVTPPEPVSAASTSVTIQGAGDPEPTTSLPAADVTITGPVDG